MVFTGIIEEIGRVKALIQETKHVLLSIQANKVLEGIKEGDSIAVNGVCLTVCDFSQSGFTVGLSPETLRRTNLGELKENDMVNLERAMSAQGRFNGHIVQGHVDGTGKIASIQPEDDSLWFWVETTKEISQYIVEKGFIAIDGTSLTICAVKDGGFQFMLVAYTQEHVILPFKKVGDTVNIEVDILGKYIKHFIQKE